MTLHPETDPTRGDFETKPRVQARHPFAAVWVFVQQVFIELRKVVTPTSREMVTYTITVIVFVLVMIALVFGMDFVFGSLSRVIFTA